MAELGGAAPSVESMRWNACERSATRRTRCGGSSAAGLVAVAAVGPLDRLRLDLEGLALEGAVGHDRRPPAGDRVPSQLEHRRIVLAAVPAAEVRQRLPLVAQEAHDMDVVVLPAAKWARRIVPSWVKPAFSYERRARSLPA